PARALGPRHVPHPLPPGSRRRRPRHLRRQGRQGRPGPDEALLALRRLQLRLPAPGLQAGALATGVGRYSTVTENGTAVLVPCWTTSTLFSNMRAGTTASSLFPPMTWTT